MKNIEEYSILLAIVKYEDGTGSKERPVFVLIHGEKHIRVLRLTSKFERKSKAIKKYYFEIIDWKQAGLWKPSWIDTIKGYDLPNDEKIYRFLGYLSDRDTDRLLYFIRDRDDLFDPA